MAFQAAEAQGTPDEQIIDESVYYDALVMGLRTFYRFDPDGRPGDTLDKILEHSVTPVLGIPESYGKPEPKARTKALILFDGSLPAARSLHRFAQMARPESTDATLVMASSDEELANDHLKRAAHYLAAHGFDAVRSEWTQDDIIEAVDERYLDAADLVVVGAHSKITVIDFLVGSLARHLIEIARKPILIGQ